VEILITLTIIRLIYKHVNGQNFYICLFVNLFMKIKGMTFAGALCLLIGVFLLSTSYDFTGFVVSNETGSSAGSVLGIILLIIGLLLIITNREERKGGIEEITEKEFQANEKTLNRIKQILQNRSIGTYEEIIKLAEGVGYEVVSGGKHFKVMYFPGKPLIGKGNRPVTIPVHGKPTKNMYIDILKDLYRGANNYSPQPA